MAWHLPGYGAEIGSQAKAYRMECALPTPAPLQLEQDS